VLKINANTQAVFAPLSVRPSNVVIYYYRLCVNVHINYQISFPFTYSFLLSSVSFRNLTAIAYQILNSGVENQDSGSRAAWLCDQENGHERKPTSKLFAETAVKRPFLFSTHSLHFEFEMMLLFAGRRLGF
jgi:hypothetical protein